MSFRDFASRYPIGMLSRLVFARVDEIGYPGDVQPLITRLTTVGTELVSADGEFIPVHPSKIEGEGVRFTIPISTEIITQEQYDEMPHEQRLNMTSVFAPVYFGRAIIEGTGQPILFESESRRVLETTSTVVDDGELVNILDVHLEFPLGITHPVPQRGNMIACLVKFEEEEEEKKEKPKKMVVDEWFGCSEQFFRSVMRLQATVKKIGKPQERKVEGKNYGFDSLNPAERASLNNFCKGNKTASLNCAKALLMLCDIGKDNVTIEEYCRSLATRLVMHPIFETPDAIHVWTALVCLSFGVQPLTLRLPNYCRDKKSNGIKMDWDIPTI